MANRKRTWTLTMVAFAFVLIVGLTVGLVLGLNGSDSGGSVDETHRTFSIDHDNNTFLMDGKPFRYVSGSFHHFRAVPEAWSHRLRTMRAAGLNTVDTYVEWSLNNPHEGVYKWDGIADIEKFIELAQQEGLYVILRPGPYICAERDNGGLPHWLFKKYPNIKMRTSDKNYLKEVEIWYAQLMPRMKRYLYGNGGPIIMVQVENEYGHFHACDDVYKEWLRDETKKYVEDKALLFTVDIPDEHMKCGKIEGVFATTDFGYDRIHEVDTIWKMLREIQPTGPLVNTEYYPGWLTHWQEENQRRDGQKVADALRTMLEQGANVNFYMFFGGTNFGFTAGANDWGFGSYVPDITSYDYDAVMDEAGRITPKYKLVQKVIAEFLDTSGIPSEPIPVKQKSYGKIKLKPIAELLSSEARQILAKSPPLETSQPQTFEELDMYSGLVLYERELPKFEIDPTLLTLNGLRDRAFVFVDQHFVGTLSRENKIYSLPLHAGLGDTLQLLVENQGRINFDITNDTKGIMGDITLQKLYGKSQILENWQSTGFPLEKIDELINAYKAGKLPEIEEASAKAILTQGPVIYHGEFEVGEIGDTYLNTIGWGKGVAYVNGMNLGRYWPLAGPQLTMYVPNEILKQGINEIVLLEYQRINKDKAELLPTVSFDDVAQLDG